MPARSPERIEFLSDLVTTVVENGGYLSWWRFRNYQIDNGPATAVLTYDDPEKGDDGDFTGGPVDLNINLMARGLGMIESGVAGIHSSIVARLLGASAINDAGLLDCGDADLILQAAVFGEIVYG